MTIYSLKWYVCCEVILKCKTITIHLQDRWYLSSEIVRDEDPLLVHGVLRAAVEDDVDKLKSLVRRGKAININDSSGNTPLHVSVIKNK